MNVPQKTKVITLILTSIVLVVSWIIMYIFLEFQLKSVIDKEFHRISDSTEKLFSINIEHDKSSLDFVLSKIVMAKGLSEAVAQKDHDKIQAIVAPYYERLKAAQENVNILTFRSNENITLFRAHKPEFFGDPLSKKRRMIIDTNDLHRSFNGFEVGKFEMTYRITKPIFYNDEYVGNVELGVSPTNFIKNLSSVFKTDIGIAIDNSQLDIMLGRDIIPINSEHVLIKGDKKLKRYFSDSEHVRNSKTYKVDMNIELKNHLSQTLGHLIVGFDITDMVEDNTRFMHNLFYLIAIIMFFLGVIHHFGFNNMLKFFSEQIYTDHLTGLLNRHALNDALFSKSTKVLILNNIKEFSLINELYGIDVGNEILIKVAQAFKSFGDRYGFDTFRISSDEYVLLKKEESFDEDVYFKIIEHLQNEINSLKILVHGIDEAVGVEIYSGIAFDQAHSLEDAQMALKKAKKQSLTYMVYSQHVDTKEYSQTVMKIKRTIRHALEHNNVIPYFQPITDIDGKIIKYEALIRIVEFDGAKKNVLLPADFLDISMRSGLYKKIAKNMIDKSLGLFASRDEKVSLNFLPNDFFNASIMDALLKGIEKFDSPQKIVVEITEQESIENFERLIKVVKKLRAMGVLIAIDDFGSGYANYAHILEIKPHYLKIDGSLIQNILTDEDSKILVRSIVNFAKELNITTVAEYVENEEIFTLLKEYGVNEFQGYYFGRPIDLINS
mgnify:CR=1 FL=1